MTARSDNFERGELVVLDTETHKVQPGLLAPPLVCGSGASPVEPLGFVMGPAQTREFVARELTLRRTLVGHQLVYDLGVVCQEWPELVPRVFDKLARGECYDTKIAEQLHDVALGQLGTRKYSLEACVDHRLGKDDAKRNATWRLSYALLEDLPLSEWPPEATQYPKDDARNTLELAKAQSQLLNQRDMTRQLRAAWVMHLGACRGFRTDPERVAELAERVDAAVAAREQRYRGIGFLRDDGTRDTRVIKQHVVMAYGGQQHHLCPRCQGECVQASPVTMKPIDCDFCDGTGLEIPGTVPRTEKSGVSADRDAMNESRLGYLVDWADNTDVKVQQTYLPWLREGTRYPLTMSPNPILETGRASYYGLVQLMPRSGGVRECITARPGYTFCSVDYAGLELCTLAQALLDLFGQSSMADVLNTGKDLHSAFGAAMAGVEYDHFVRVLADPVSPQHQIFADLRQKSKAANFGFPGGMGAPKFVLTKRREGYRLCGDCKPGDYVRTWKGRPITPVCPECLVLADRLRAAWFDQWPEMRNFFELANEDAERGYVVQLVSGRIRGGVSMPQAANDYFQGRAADGAKHALWLVGKECYTEPGSPLWGSYPIAFVHDQIISEMPLDQAEVAGARKAEVMVAAMREWVPDVLVKAKPEFMTHWRGK